MEAKKNNWEIVKLYDEISRRSSLDILSSGRYFINSLGYKRRLAGDIAEKLQLQPSDKVLDLGCNVGIYHRYLAPKVALILGVDGAETSIAKARIGNPQKNIEYRTFDILGEWPTLNQDFNKVLVYSVIHFFDSIDDVRKLFQKIVASTEKSKTLTILLGEVRTKEQYDTFLAQQKVKTKKTWRDRKFALNRAVSRLVLGNLKGYPCTSFGIQELLNVGAEFGFEGRNIPQERFHPFYNTCSDFVFERKN